MLLVDIVTDDKFANVIISRKQEVCIPRVGDIVGGESGTYRVTLVTWDYTSTAHTLVRVYVRPI